MKIYKKNRMIDKQNYSKIQIVTQAYQRLKQSSDFNIIMADYLKEHTLFLLDSIFKINKSLKAQLMSKTYLQEYFEELDRLNAELLERDTLL